MNDNFKFGRGFVVSTYKKNKNDIVINAGIDPAISEFIAGIDLTEDMHKITIMQIELNDILRVISGVPNERIT